MLRTQAVPSRELTVSGRVALAGLGIAGLVLLVTARYLEPDPRGYGTHEQLGFSSCSFLSWTGRVCPTCGATTAWAYALRGKLSRAAAANLGGVLSCYVAIVAVPWLLASAAMGRWIFFRPRFQTLLVVGTAWLLVVILDWLRRFTLS